MERGYAHVDAGPPAVIHLAELSLLNNKTCQSDSVGQCAKFVLLSDKRFWSIEECHLVRCSSLHM